MCQGRGVGTGDKYMEIIIEGPTFYDEEDENLFFNSLYSLPDYKAVKGIGLKLHVQLTEPVSDETIKRMVVVCRRWQIDIEPLRSLRRSSNNGLLLWDRDVEAG